jgi:ParB-like chromosome segregation protein Spo0J
MTKNPKEIGRHETFMNLFPINEELLKRIEEDMKENQYDDSQPIILATWEGQDEPVCIDGYTRLQAAINAGIDDVPVFSHELDTEDEALEKAILFQARRRNMSDGDILACIAVLDERRKAGRPKKELAQHCANFPEADPEETRAE